MKKMNKFKIWTIRKLLTSPCPGSVPRSGNEGKDINCYSLKLYQDETPLISIRSIDDHAFYGLYFRDGEPHPKVAVPFNLSSGLRISIKHYYGLSDYSYFSLSQYVKYEWTWLYKLLTFITISKQAVPQFFFNKRHLELPRRMKLLQKIIAKQSEEALKAFNSTGMMNYVYSTKWIFHPQKTEMQQTMNLYLESFVASGELKKNPGINEYLITGKAIATLEQYQIETSRSKAARRSNRWMITLTCILALSTSIQAGLITSSALFDLGDILIWLNHLWSWFSGLLHHTTDMHSACSYYYYV